jgi:hypothetical protein
MITISDCEAFCDADSGWARELARRERLSMVQAYAQAHRSMTGATIPVMQTHPAKSVDVDSSYCRAA